LKATVLAVGHTLRYSAVVFGKGQWKVPGRGRFGLLLVRHSAATEEILFMLYCIYMMKRALYEERDNRVSQVGALVERPMHVRRLSLAVELGLGLRVLLSSLLPLDMVRGFQSFPITPDSRN
jgi:hypothetical protein